MTIVTYHPKRKPKPPPKAAAAAITGARIVTAKQRGKGRRVRPDEPDDVEVSDSVKAFFARMLKRYP